MGDHGHMGRERCGRITEAPILSHGQCGCAGEHPVAPIQRQVREPATGGPRASLTALDVLPMAFHRRHLRNSFFATIHTSMPLRPG
jgi:hypothetical protein